MKSLTFIEIDVPYCALTYGETTGAGTCPAVLGIDSDIKCFNTIKTCPVREAFLESEVTLRFAKPASYLPREIDIVADSIVDTSFTPATISLGENLGQRATLNVTFVDHKHSDTGDGFDRYLADRDYNPYERGTFWGKFRARQPFLRGRAIRWITGLLGQELSAMETRHFIIESFDGPTPDGSYTLVAKDVLKLVDGDRAQAPAMSNGFLVTGVSSGATSFTLSPSGIGNAEYTSSGTLAIGGQELIQFTRSGDVVTLSSGTLAQNHNAQDRAQLVLKYTAADPADIIYDLMVNYADVPAAFITLSDWKAETSAFLGRLYTATICEPTSVATLISELIQQACLVIWWDDVSRKIRLQVLRSILTDSARFSPENTIQGTLTVKEQPDKRLSQVQTYFGQINPLKQLSDKDNYRSTSVIVDEQAEEDYGGAAIKTVMSRWIPALGRSVADRFGEIQISRFRDPPRRFAFDTARYAETDLRLGSGYRIASKSLQDDTGALIDVPAQITRLNTPADRFKGEAEEVLFASTPEDPDSRFIIVDSDSLNINLRSVHDSLYQPAESGVTVTCVVNTGVIVGSTSTGLPSFDVGSWPAGVTIILIVRGTIQGMGGDGGFQKPGGIIHDGFPGGVALYTRYATHIDVSSGKIWSGGGGGGWASGFGGGGGAGRNPGNGGDGPFGPASSGAPGTQTAGGIGASSLLSSNPAGNGGGPGVAGGSTAYSAGGAAGAAIDGVSFVTVDAGPGDVRGPQIN